VRLIDPTDVLARRCIAYATAASESADSKRAT